MHFAEERIFDDRRHAGAELGRTLRQLPGISKPVVLALPRGGVPVGYEVSRALGALLDVFLVRKLGLPGYPELAMGAIASGNVRVLNDEVTISKKAIEPKCILCSHVFILKFDNHYSVILLK